MLLFAARTLDSTHCFCFVWWNVSSYADVLFILFIYISLIAAATCFICSIISASFSFLLYVHCVNVIRNVSGLKGKMKWFLFYQTLLSFFISTHRMATLFVTLCSRPACDSLIPRQSHRYTISAAHISSVSVISTHSTFHSCDLDAKNQGWEIFAPADDWAECPENGFTSRMKRISSTTHDICGAHSGQICGNIYIIPSSSWLCWNISLSTTAFVTTIAFCLAVCVCVCMCSFARFVRYVYGAVGAVYE